jgi:hypothetical protein
MSINQVIDIEYMTGYLNYDKIRKGIIQNRDKLIENGYTCSWTQDIDLNSDLDANKNPDKGYIVLDDVVITSLMRDGLPITISIFRKSQRAKVHGDNHVYQNEFEDVKQDFAKFAELTGINLKVKQTSEPY